MAKKSKKKGKAARAAKAEKAAKVATAVAAVKVVKAVKAAADAKTLQAQALPAAGTAPELGAGSDAGSASVGAAVVAVAEGAAGAVEALKAAGVEKVAEAEKALKADGVAGLAKVAKEAGSARAAKAAMPKLADFTYSGRGRFRMADQPTSLAVDPSMEGLFEKETAKNGKRIAKLVERLYAERREGVVFMIQAMDAAGKDSTVEHVLAQVNPAFTSSYSFKAPSKEELAHDYLWRAHCHLPQRGMLGIFNRSYYEDVLVVRVSELWKGYSWPARCCNMDEKVFFDTRYRQIADYERYLYENGYRLVKVFLNVGLQEQAQRFIARIDCPEKNWKFSADDLQNRAVWDKYMQAFEASIGATATQKAPWYVVPADQKFVARWLVSEALLHTLEDIDPQYPVGSDADRAVMADCRAKLVAGEI